MLPVEEWQASHNYRWYCCHPYLRYWSHCCIYYSYLHNISFSSWGRDGLLACELPSAEHVCRELHTNGKFYIWLFVDISILMRNLHPIGNLMAPVADLSRKKYFILVTVVAALSSSILAFNTSIGYSTFEFPFNLNLSLRPLYFTSNLYMRSLDSKFSVTLL